MADFGIVLMSALVWAVLFALCIALAHWLKAPRGLFELWRYVLEDRARTHKLG